MPSEIGQSEPKRFERRYTAEDYERGLQMLALHMGKTRPASDALKEQGYDIPHRTLHDWKRKQHADRYAEIVAERAPRIADRIAAEMESYVLDAGEVQHEALAKLKDKLEAEENQEALVLAKIQQHLGIPIGIATQRSGELRGRPTVIHEHRSTDDIMRIAAQKGYIDGQAVEIEAK